MLNLKSNLLMLGLAAILSIPAQSVQADQVRLISTGAVGVAQIHQMLSSANQTIDLMTYIWDPCSSISKMMLEILKAKARAGVKVRILIDGDTQDTEQRGQFTGYLASFGIELRYFNLRAFLNPERTYRTHAKMIVVDSQSYYTGGRNIADDYFSMAIGNWIDRDAYVTGRSGEQAQETFDLLWNSSYTKRNGPASAERVADWARTCLARKPLDQKLADTMKSKRSEILASERAFSCNDIEVVVDNPTFKNGIFQDAPAGQRLVGKLTSYRVLQTIQNARKNLWIENYSYLPSGDIEAAIIEQRRRGVNIQLYTNADSDVGGMITGLKIYFHDRDDRDSQEIHTISPKGTLSDRWALTPAMSDDGKKVPPFWMIHSKLFVAGGDNGEPETALISSYNIDPRSYKINVESGVVVRNCPAFAAHVRDSITKRLQPVIERDKNCKACNQKLEPGFFDMFLGWASFEQI